MKHYLYILAILSVVCACVSEQSSMKEQLERSFSKDLVEWGVGDLVQECAILAFLTETPVKHHYDAKLVVYHPIAKLKMEIPCEIWSEDRGNVYRKIKMSDDELTFTIKDYISRLNAELRGGSDSRNGARDELPSWAYGTWTCTTPYGTETMKIEEYGGIWNIANGYADFGSFTYSNGVIRANFSKDGGLVTSMPLDMNNQRIEYGGGYYWRKTR